MNKCNHINHIIFDTYNKRYHCTACGKTLSKEIVMRITKKLGGQEIGGNEKYIRGGNIK